MQPFLHATSKCYLLSYMNIDFTYVCMYIVLYNQNSKKVYCNFKVHQILDPKSQIEIRFSNKQNWIEIFNLYLTTKHMYL